MQTTRSFVDEPARRVELFGEYDCVVLGGGPAGIAASVSAARRGARTLLLERYGFLGGMGTAAGVTNFCGLHANLRGDIRRVVRGVADELLARIDSLGGLNAPHLILGRIHAQAYDTAAYKCAADAMLEAAGVEVLFHALAAGVAMREPRRIDALFVETRSGRRAVRARVFVDASGDGDLAHWAGVPTEKGGEPGLLYPTMMFRVNGVDPQRALEALPSIDRLMDEARASGDFAFPRRGAILRPQKNPIEWRANVTQLRNAQGTAVDGTDARQLSDGEREGRRQVLDYLRFLRARVPGFERAYLVDIAPQLGIRETRRVVGEYRLSGDDVLGCARFDDSIGVNGWPMEVHVAGDVRWVWPEAPDNPGFNQLPYRMILPLEMDNLLVAGRCASMTHEGQSAARVTGACFAMGQAAGTAAALSLGAAVDPRALPAQALQSALREDGAWLGDGPPPA
jgi:hypothetical protein